ncbi:MAG: hypothetical protein ACREQ2_14935 [Candidatus Binatia bacterium]
MRQSFYGALAILSFLSLSGCSKIGEFVQGSGSDQVDRRRVVQTPANFDVALKENQTALAQGRPAADVALFNIGVILAHPSNPKKDYSRAILSFEALVKGHPQSVLLEPSKTWIQVLELQQEVAEERQKLAEERRALTRDRETLSQERQKLDYVNQRSLQLDLEIEKRRRRSLRK